MVAPLRVALKHLQRDERVEEVARAARVQPQTFTHGLGLPGDTMVVVFKKD